MKILVVDDSIFTQTIISNLLKKFSPSIDISTASDGIEGFEKYKTIMPDYVFVDLLMPKLNGIELIKKIKNYNRSANIFVITADIQKSIRQEIEALNVKAFISKPINEEKIKYILDLIKGDNIA